MSERMINVLCDEPGGEAVHILEYVSAMKLKCYCDRSMRVIPSRVAVSPMTSPLVCKECDQRRKTWEEWWDSQDKKEAAR